MSDNSQNGRRLGRRALLAGAVGSAGAVGAAAVLATNDSGDGSGNGSEKQPPGSGSGKQHPQNLPEPETYGIADTREDLWPRADNSFLLPLEQRPRDKEFGRVWMRDTYVNRFTVDGRSLYVATGTSRGPGPHPPGSWNDGIFVWVSRALRGPWKLADTTGVRPGAEKGKVWSPEFADENRPGRMVVAPWQEHWHDEEFGKRGNVWAPEVHYFRGKWYILACMGDHSRKVGSFMLVSESGIEGPYRLVEGNREKPFGDPVSDGPEFIKPGAYHHIDASLYTEEDGAWLVLHNSLYAKFRADMEDIVPATDLPQFRQQPYSPEPYLEGAYVFKFEGKYHLLHAVWDCTSRKDDGGTRHAYDPDGDPGVKKHQYNTVVAVSDRFEGPYSRRWTAGVGTGHNNFFTDDDGRPWATFFRNPANGYWSDPSREDDTAVPGVVRLEWTGPEGGRLYVQRRDRDGSTGDGG